MVLELDMLQPNECLNFIHLAKTEDRPNINSTELPIQKSLCDLCVSSQSVKISDIMTKKLETVRSSSSAQDVSGLLQIDSNTHYFRGTSNQGTNHFTNDEIFSSISSAYQLSNNLTISDLQLKQDHSQFSMSLLQVVLGASPGYTKLPDSDTHWFDT